LAADQKALRFGGEGGSTILARHGTVPVRDGGGKEGGIEEPHIFETEDSGRGDGGGGSDYERDVIRCRARERGERGTGKRVVPVVIEKSAIKPGKNWVFLAVSPGKETIKQQELKKGQGVDQSVEGGDEVLVEIGVVFLRGGPDQVEIPKDEPKSGDLRGEHSHLSDKISGEPMVRGGIDVCDREGNIRGGGGERGRKAKTARDGGSEREHARIPGCEHAAAAPIGIHNRMISER
jgi:hypothetical protein